MRVLILITLFCNMAFSALYLNGAEYTQVVTINHSQVEETSSDFLYQLKIPRVGALLTAVESADDVAFTNVNDTTRRARWVVYTPDTIFMYSHIAVSSTVDTSYRIQYGKSLNEVNSSSTFTNCGYNDYIPFNETSGTSFTNVARSSTGTHNGSITVNNPGVFYKNTSVGTISSYSKTDAQVSTYNGSTKIFTEGVFSVQSYATTQILMVVESFTITRQVWVRVTSTSFNYLINGESHSIPIENLPSAGTPFHFAIWFDASEVEANRTKTWLNGVLFTQSSTQTALASVNTNIISGNSVGAGFIGTVDEIGVGVTYTNGAIRYNMLFNPSTFSTLGTPIATDFSAEMGIDTLTFTCSAEGAITYQWFLDGAEIVGETDSVLVIYADSTFYSTAHTLYCLVNSSVISDSWVITTEFSAEMGIDTLRLVCSAENALTYQWYDNNVPVSGETDSVYTIYADSTFYSIKHVIYCLVNGSVKSGEWKFQSTTSRTSRWDSYKLFYKQAYKNTWK